MNAGIEIQKGVPMPPRRGGGRNSLYPFGDMEVGDSFAVPLRGEVDCQGHDKASVNIAKSAYMWARRHNTSSKFSVRILRNEGVARCWRVA